MSESRPTEATDTAHAAAAFDATFRRLYLTFHRRDGVRRDVSPASRAVLTHLAHSGPLSIGDAAAHFGRSQSAVSELVTQLENNGLVERRPDETDRRRTLVWLTDDGRAELRRDESVLGHELLERAIERLATGEIERALVILNDLVTAAGVSDAHDGPTQPIERNRP